MNQEELKTVSADCQSTSLKDCHVKYNVRAVKAKIMNVIKKLDNVNDAVITMW